MKCGPSLVAFAESVEKSVTPPHVKVVERDEAQPERAGEIAFIGSVVGVEQRVAQRLHGGFVDRLPGRGRVCGTTRDQRHNREDRKGASHR